jgi:NAD(P)H-dependent FMN reductase
MTKLVGISGSLRAGSYNTALLNAAAALAPEGVDFAIGTIRGIPVYDGDVETNEGIPAAVTALKDVIAGSDGVLLVTPEYNNSIPGAFKNAIDWTTRPPADIARVWRDRPVATIGASPGNFGTILSQDAWLPVLRTLGTKTWFGARLMVSRADTVFDASGALNDEALRERLRKFVAGFAEFARANAR